MKVNPIPLVLLISLSLTNIGCSVIGYGLGVGVDNRKSKGKIVNQYDYSTIEYNRKITIQLDDNSMMTGNFKEFKENYLSLETIFGIDIIHKKDIIKLAVEPKKEASLRGLYTGLMLDIAFVLWRTSFFEKSFN